ncbi:unnamed protein product [Gadus morhua 'NCC']
MTCAVLSILVMFVCLAHAMEDVYSPQAIPVKEIFPIVWEANPLKDIRASPANRMTRAVLSILVMFVCLAPMLEVNSTTDDHKNATEAVELSINSLKEQFKFKMDAQADKLTEQIRIVDGMLDVLQNAGPEYSAAKKQLETSKETGSELKAKLLLNNENSEFLWESIRELFKDLDETEVNKDEL